MIYSLGSRFSWFRFNFWFRDVRTAPYLWMVRCSGSVPVWFSVFDFRFICTCLTSTLGFKSLLKLTCFLNHVLWFSVFLLNFEEWFCLFSLPRFIWAFLAIANLLWISLRGFIICSLSNLMFIVMLSWGGFKKVCVCFSL